MVELSVNPVNAEKVKQRKQLIIPRLRNCFWTNFERNISQIAIILNTLLLTITTTSTPLLRKEHSQIPPTQIYQVIH